MASLAERILAAGRTNPIEQMGSLAQRILGAVPKTGTLEAPAQTPSFPTPASAVPLWQKIIGGQQGETFLQTYNRVGAENTAATKAVFDPNASPELRKKGQDIYAGMTFGFTGTLQNVSKKGAVKGIQALKGSTDNVARQGIKNVPFQGYDDLTTKFLDYSKGKTTLSRQEIMDFAKRPELKKGEADLLNKLSKDLPEGKLPAQEFADSIRRDLLELKPVRVKEPQYKNVSIYERTLGNIGIDYRSGYKHPYQGKNYEEVVFESPITTNGSSHFPNSKNYFAHTRGDEVVESGKKIWREQEIQSDLLQKDKLESSVGFNYDDFFDWSVKKTGKSPGNLPTEKADELEKLYRQELVGKEFGQLSPFTNDRYGERIMRERIKEKASKGYSKYRLPTGETIGKIEGFEMESWNEGKSFWSSSPKKLTPENLKVGDEAYQSGARDYSEAWIITDILGDGRFKAVSKEAFEESAAIQDLNIGDIPTDRYKDFVSQIEETFDLTGKSNPQYRRYSDWGKFLKNKFGGKEVTDAQGNSWIEIDLKKEQGRMPIEAFGMIPLVFPHGTNDKQKEEIRKHRLLTDYSKQKLK